MISCRIPPSCSVVFEAIVLYTRKPLPVSELNNGAYGRIQVGYAHPKKNVFTGDAEIHNNIQINNCILSATHIEKIRQKIRGTRNHHRFAYIAYEGVIKNGVWNNT